MDKLTMKELERAFKVLNEYDPKSLDEGWVLTFVVYRDMAGVTFEDYKTGCRFHKEVKSKVQNGQWIVLNDVML